MRDMWKTLGLKATSDVKAIKEAYSDRLKETWAEEGAYVFKELKDAYERALNFAKYNPDFDPAKPLSRSETLKEPQEEKPDDEDDLSLDQILEETKPEPPKPAPRPAVKTTTRQDLTENLTRLMKNRKARKYYSNWDDILEKRERLSAKDREGFENDVLESLLQQYGYYEEDDDSHRRKRYRKKHGKHELPRENLKRIFQELSWMDDDIKDSVTVERITYIGQQGGIFSRDKNRRDHSHFLSDLQRFFILILLTFFMVLLSETTPGFVGSLLRAATTILILYLAFFTVTRLFKYLCQGVKGTIKFVKDVVEEIFD